MRDSVKPIRVLVMASLFVPGLLHAQAPTFRLAGHEVEVVGDLGDWDLSVEVQRAEAGVEIAHLRLRRDGAASPPELTLRWALPSHDIVGHWTTGAYFNKSIEPDWGPSRVSSKLAQQAPVPTASTFPRVGCSGWSRYGRILSHQTIPRA